MSRAAAPPPPPAQTCAACGRGGAGRVEVRQSVSQSCRHPGSEAHQPRRRAEQAGQAGQAGAPSSSPVVVCELLARPDVVAGEEHEALQALHIEDLGVQRRRARVVLRQAGQTRSASVPPTLHCARPHCRSRRTQTHREARDGAGFGRVEHVAVIEIKQVAVAALRPVPRLARAGHAGPHQHAAARGDKEGEGAGCVKPRLAISSSSGKANAVSAAHEQARRAACIPPPRHMHPAHRYSTTIESCFSGTRANRPHLQAGSAGQAHGSEL